MPYRLTAGPSSPKAPQPVVTQILRRPQPAVKLGQTETVISQAKPQAKPDPHTRQSSPPNVSHLAPPPLTNDNFPTLPTVHRPTLAQEPTHVASGVEVRTQSQLRPRAPAVQSRVAFHEAGAPQVKVKLPPAPHPIRPELQLDIHRALMHDSSEAVAVSSRREGFHALEVWVDHRQDVPPPHAENGETLMVHNVRIERNMRVSLNSSK